jgi:hypothetical protein
MPEIRLLKLHHVEVRDVFCVVTPRILIDIIVMHRCT